MAQMLKLLDIPQSKIAANRKENLKLIRNAINQKNLNESQIEKLHETALQALPIPCQMKEHSLSQADSSYDGSECDFEIPKNGLIKFRSKNGYNRQR